jgi:hypothetical protein
MRAWCASAEGIAFFVIARSPKGDVAIPGT